MKIINALIIFSVTMLLVGCGGGSSSPSHSGPSSGSSSGPSLVPGMPSGIVVTAGNNEATITWGTVTGATSYNVYRSAISGSQGTKIGASTTTSYVDSTAVNGTTYYYAVTAVNTAGEGPVSTQSAAATPVPPQPIVFPDPVTSTEVKTGGRPVIQTMYTADPAPMVHNGTLYLFSSHDQDTGGSGFNMKDWVLSTTTDMVNWTQHGVIASLRDFPWVTKDIGDGFENGAWAPQVIERDGKWYLYCPIQGRGIGVLVADNPKGPYTDPIKKALITGYDSIDPTVFIDDQGQATLAWGNPNFWSVKLNKDMISYDTSVGDKGIIGHPMTINAFGARTPPDANRGTSYEEGPWLYKRNNLNYLFFAAGPIAEHLGYSTAPTAQGPWTYGGVLMDVQSTWTNHPGVVDFNGKTYLFYHNAGLPGGDGFKRSVCVDELKFNPDGSVPTVQSTKEGPPPIATLDPYKRVEAETIAWSSGVKIEPSSAGGQNVRDIHDRAYIKVRNVDFGATGARSFMANLFSTVKARAATGAQIEIRLGKPDGQLIGTLPVSGTGGEWKAQSTSITGVTGVQDVVFVFRGTVGQELFKFDYWQFSQSEL